MTEILVQCLLFPYYIVRFKRGRRLLFSFFQKSFHTTQYDLNFACFIFLLCVICSFHTTQYDLNPQLFTSIEKKYNTFPYYIVRFKHIWRELLCSPFINTFKSYYVVWKLLKYHRQYQCVYMFKSYYVVWKRNSNIRYIYCYCGLNRTMQYGN